MCVSVCVWCGVCVSDTWGGIKREERKGERKERVRKVEGGKEGERKGGREGGKERKKERERELYIDFPYFVFLQPTRVWQSS